MLCQRHLLTAQLAIWITRDERRWSKLLSGVFTDRRLVNSLDIDRVLLNPVDFSNKPAASASVCLVCACAWCGSWSEQKVSYRMQPFRPTHCVLLSSTYWTGRLHYSQCWPRTNNFRSLPSSSAILQFFYNDKLSAIRKETNKISEPCRHY